MKRRVAFLLAASLLTPFGARAQLPDPTPAPLCPVRDAAVAAAPMIEVRVGGLCFDLSSFLGLIPGSSKLIGTTLQNIGLGNLAIIQALTVVMNPDPFISAGFSTQHLAPVPLTYDWLFGLPITPDLYDEARSEVEVAMVPGIGAATVSTGLYPTYISGYSNLFATNHGVDLGTTTCTAGVNSPCDYGVATNTFPPTLYADLEARFSYTQDGLLGIASWAGRVDLISSAAVPEPSSVLLVLSGVLVIAGASAARRRRG
jgi:hypothetical protein